MSSLGRSLRLKGTFRGRGGIEMKGLEFPVGNTITDEKEG